MSALGERIEAAARERGISLRALSVQATGSTETVRKIVDGTTSHPRTDTLAKIEAALELPPGTLYAILDEKKRAVTGDSIPAPVEPPDLMRLPRDVPVLGTAAGAAAGAFEFNGEIIDYVRRPPAFVEAKGLYAIYITGTSMEPEHRPGDLRFVHPHRPPAIGDTVVIQMRHRDEGPIEAYIKHLVRRAESKVTAAQLNPKAEIDFQTKYMVAIHKVLTQNDLFGL